MNRTTRQNRTAATSSREARFWMIAISGLFILFLFAAYYRFGGFGRSSPTSVIIPDQQQLTQAETDLDPEVQVGANGTSMDSPDSLSLNANPSGEQPVGAEPSSSVAQKSSSGFNPAPFKLANQYVSSAPNITSQTNESTEPNALRPINSNFQPANELNPVVANEDHQLIKDPVIQPSKSSWLESGFSGAYSGSTEEPSDSTILDSSNTAVDEKVEGRIPGSTLSRPLTVNSLRSPKNPPESDLRSVISNDLNDKDLHENSNIQRASPSEANSIRSKPKQASRIANAEEMEEIQPTRYDEDEPRLFGDAPVRPKRTTPYSLIAGPKESYWSVAQTVYGDGRLFRALFALNRSALGDHETIEPGALVKTPPIETLADKFPDLIPTDILRSLKAK